MLLSWNVIYDLKPGFIVKLDTFLSTSTVSINAFIFKLFDVPVYHSARVISLGTGSGIEVIDGCNILGILGMYICFIIAYNGPRDLMVKFLFWCIEFIYFECCKNIFAYII